MELNPSSTDPEFWREAWDSMRPHSAAGPMGIEFVAIDADTLVLQLEITDATRQPFGLFHGGVSMLLAESAASFHSCWGTDLTKVAPVGVDINGTHLNSAREGTVRATARVIKRGRTLVVHDIDIEHVESGKLLCKARVSNLLIAHK